MLECLVFSVEADENEDLAEVSVDDEIVRSKVSHSKDAWLYPGCREVLLKLSLFNDLPESSRRKLFLSCLSLFFALVDSFMETLLYILRPVAVGGKGGRLARSELSDIILNILNSSLFIFVFL